MMNLMFCATAAEFLLILLLVLLRILGLLLSLFTIGILPVSLLSATSERRNNDDDNGNDGDDDCGALLSGKLDTLPSAFKVLNSDDNNRNDNDSDDDANLVFCSTAAEFLLMLLRTLGLLLSLSTIIGILLVSVTIVVVSSLSGASDPSSPVNEVLLNVLRLNGNGTVALLDANVVDDDDGNDDDDCVKDMLSDFVGVLVLDFLVVLEFL